MPDHDTDLTWRRQIVTVEDLGAWSYDWSGNAYSATGPCPVCHAPNQSGQTYARGYSGGGTGGGDGASGKRAGEAAPDVEPLGPDPDVEVDVDCTCGDSHGKDKDGCGARWIVRIGDLP
jgi:hypothetical protein